MVPPFHTDVAPFDAFMSQYQRDREDSCVRRLGEYLAMFPGEDTAIARAYLLAVGEPPDFDINNSTIGPYLLQEELGRGGQGVVYRAIHESTGSVVALKILPRLLGGTNAQLRFRREAKVAARLHHPGICTVFDAGIEHGTPYIAMQYVDGNTLAYFIRWSRASLREGRRGGAIQVGTPEGHSERLTLKDRRRGIGNMGRILGLMENIARALQAAHEAGVIHRDLKPGNIMITPEGVPVLTDFGLARDEESEPMTLTRSSDLVGTPAYMSPEQVVRHHEWVDTRTDIWSLGVTLYECATLHRPFQGATREALFQEILEKTPPSPHYKNPNLPKDLCTVIMTMLSKERDRRYQSASDLADDISRIRTCQPVQARPRTIAIRLRRWVRRHPGFAAGLVLGFAMWVSAVAGAELMNAPVAMVPDASNPGAEACCASSFG